MEKESMIAQQMFDMVDRDMVDMFDMVDMVDQQVKNFPYQRYESIDNNEKFILKVDVPGCKEEVMLVSLDEGRLTIQGERVATSECSTFTSKFKKTFTLDPTVDVDQFTANLKNGVLTIAAPKDSSKLKEKVRRIPITSAVEDENKTIEQQDDSQQDQLEK